MSLAESRTALLHFALTRFSHPGCFILLWLILPQSVFCSENLFAYALPPSCNLETGQHVQELGRITFEASEPTITVFPRRDRPSRRTPLFSSKLIKEAKLECPCREESTMEFYTTHVTLIELLINYLKGIEQFVFIYRKQASESDPAASLQIEMFQKEEEEGADYGTLEEELPLYSFLIPSDEYKQLENLFQKNIPASFNLAEYRLLGLRCSWSVLALYSKCRKTGKNILIGYALQSTYDSNVNTNIYGEGVLTVLLIYEGFAPLFDPDNPDDTYSADATSTPQHGQANSHDFADADWDWEAPPIYQSGGVVSAPPELLHTAAAQGPDCDENLPPTYQSVGGNQPHNIPLEDNPAYQQHANDESHQASLPQPYTFPIIGTAPSHPPPPVNLATHPSKQPNLPEDNEKPEYDYIPANRIPIPSTAQTGSGSSTSSSSGFHSMSPAGYGFPGQQPALQNQATGYTPPPGYSSLGALPYLHGAQGFMPGFGLHRTTAAGGALSSSVSPDLLMPPPPPPPLPLPPPGYKTTTTYLNGIWTHTIEPIEQDEPSGTKKKGKKKSKKK